ncbi:MAG: dihydrodipicolinate reductase [Lentisphaerae bacterium]|nr:dihydrodipicolinate reductase [Lentisphaerota bacterium]
MKRGRKPIRLGLFGFGRTGHWVAHELIATPGVELPWVIRSGDKHAGEYASRLCGFQRDTGMIHSIEEISSRFFRKHRVDAIIDFSSSETVHSYAGHVPDGLAVVWAISNYCAADEKVLRKMAERCPVLRSPNISMGINAVMLAAQILRRLLPDADVQIVEEHFKDKADISGTAVRLARKLGLDPKTDIRSVRAGGIVGRHEVIFGLPHQTLRLVHESISRSAFGRGALMAARMLIGRKPGLYKLDQLLHDNMVEAVRSMEKVRTPRR